MSLNNRRAILVILVIPTFWMSALATDFDQCIRKINDGDFGVIGGTNNRGQPMNVKNATAITYEMCVSACGSAPEPFSWPVFSQQFSGWLLPYLALVSQLPFGANDRLDNLDSMLLSVGSPVLAAYSLVLTALNGRWITKRFFPFREHPNAYAAVRVLSSLQQAPLRIRRSIDNQLLKDLVTIPENRKWWRELSTWLNMTHTWSISAAASISWVAIAYLFTVVDSFTGGVTTAVNANGQGVGSIWLWLVPIVVGWLQISPKCDSEHLHKAIDNANSHALVSMPDGDLRSAEKDEYAIYLSSEHFTSRNDEIRSPPIFNYARLFAWVQAVEEVAEVICPAVDNDYHQRSRWGYGTWRRICVASCLALFLQWGTTGAAVVFVWYTPTTGLGCRSAAYIIYGVISTLVWFVMLLSSILSHYSATAPFQAETALSTKLAELLSIFLRRVGKIAAACNGAGLVVTCLFQFSNIFNRCYCNSSVFYWGSKRAYDVITFLEADVSAMRNAWIGGVILAAGSALIFFVFVNLYINPAFPLPEHND